MDEMAKIKLDEAKTDEIPVTALPNYSRHEAIEERLLILAIKLIDVETDFNGYDECLSQRGRQIIAHLKKSRVDKTTDSELPSDLNDLVNKLSILADNEENSTEEIIKEINTCIKELKMLAIKSKLGELASTIKTAEADGDEDKMAKLLEEFNRYSLNLDNLNKSGKGDKK